MGEAPEHDRSKPQLRLRDVTRDDLAVLFEHQRDPEAARMAAFRSRDWPAFTAHWERVLSDRAVIANAILLDDRLVGSIVCFDAGGRRLVGYWIDREFWGRGVATNALRAFVARVAHRPLHAFVAKRNLASIRVLEKCGFAVHAEQIGAPDGRGEPVEELVFRLDGK